MSVVWVKGAYDYADEMSRDLESDSRVTLVQGVALQSRWARLAGAVLRRLFPGLATRWSRYSFLRSVGKGLRGSQDERIICLFDSSPYADDPEFIRRLRHRHPGCRLVLIIYNVIVDSRRGQFIRDQYDLAYTFDPENAREFGFRHFDGIYSAVSGVKRRTSHDLVFIGLDKGRLGALYDLYQMLRRKGLRCFFYVVSDQQECDDAEGFVVSSSRMSYGQSISLVQSANCILDLVPECQSGLSLRCIQAVVYGTRLLTNSTWVEASCWFDRARMSVFDSLESVDIAFIQDTSEIKVEYGGEFSPLHLVDSVRAELFGVSDHVESGRVYGAT